MTNSIIPLWWTDTQPPSVKIMEQNVGKLTLTIWTLQQADINIQEAENAAKAFEEAYSAEVEITPGFR